MKPAYECPRCGMQHASKRDLGLHVHRKRPCSALRQDIPLALLQAQPQYKRPQLVACRDCSKAFTRQALYDHIKHQRCPVPKHRGLDLAATQGGYAVSGTVPTDKGLCHGRSDAGITTSSECVQFLVLTFSPGNNQVNAAALGRGWSVVCPLWHIADISKVVPYPTLLHRWRALWELGVLDAMLQATGHLSAATLLAGELHASRNTNNLVFSSIECMATPPNNQSCLVRTATPQPNLEQKKTIRITDGECLAVIEGARELSEESRKQYIGCLRRIVSGGPGRRGSAPSPALLPGSSLLWCMPHPEQACQLLQKGLAAQGLYNAKNMHNYMAALRSVMAHHPELSKLVAIRDRWTRVADNLVVTPLIQEAKANKPSERQQKGFVTYAEIAAKFTQLCTDELGSNDSLLVGLIGLADDEVLPQRRDFGAVRLHIGHEPAAEEAQGNYLVVTKDGGTGQHAGYLHLSRYKTSKTYGVKHIELPWQFLRTLLASLQEHPRDWLFTKVPNKNVKPNTPYGSANSFGQFANKAFKRIFGKPLTISGARHSFITHLHCSQQWARMSDAQREDIARGMGHSYNTACRYRFVGV